MPTAGRFNLYRLLGDPGQRIILNINPATVINEGDAMWFDIADGLAKPITADAQVAHYCGIALGTNPVKHFPDSSEKTMSIFIGDVIAKMFIPAGQAMSYFTDVFIGSGPQEVTVDDNGGAKTNVLGHLVMDAEEYKGPRNSFAGEEISVLMRKSCILERTF